MLRANEDVSVSDVGATATSEQFELFSKYQDSRHAGGDMATMDFFDFQALVEETPVDTFVQEFRTCDGDLVGACLIDAMSDGVSAVYSFFDPDLKQRSLGTLMILKLIETASARDLPHVYLGYWVNGREKWSTKINLDRWNTMMAKAWRYLNPSVVGGLNDLLINDHYYLNGLSYLTVLAGLPMSHPYIEVLLPTKHHAVGRTIAARRILKTSATRNGCTPNVHAFSTPISPVSHTNPKI